MFRSMARTINDDLPAILGQFRVGLLPYRVGHPMTDHVNPDKLHHYLNAGLEVVAVSDSGSAPT